MQATSGDNTEKVTSSGKHFVHHHSRYQKITNPAQDYIKVCKPYRSFVVIVAVDFCTTFLVIKRLFTGHGLSFLLILPFRLASGVKSIDLLNTF